MPSTVILDSAVAYVMDKVDFVLVGSEAVVESGGLINAVGSSQIAIIAKAANKPFYALAERSATHLTLLLNKSNPFLPVINSIDFFPCPNMIYRIITPEYSLSLTLPYQPLPMRRTRQLSHPRILRKRPFKHL